MKTPALLLSSLAFFACATEPGVGIRTLVPSAEVAFTIAAGRETDDGWLRLSNDYQIKLESFTTAGMDLLLEAAASGGNGEAPVFDPANPPPGYLICHNGHCDAEDGRQPSYAEVEAELAAGAGGAISYDVVGQATWTSFDVLAGLNATGNCDVACELPEANLSRLRLNLSGLQAAGHVRDGRETARFAGSRAWRYAAPGDVGFDQALQLAVDLGDPAALPVRILVAFDASLFDGLDWSVLAVDETIDLADGASGEVVLKNMATQAFEILLDAEIAD